MPGAAPGRPLLPLQEVAASFRHCSIPSYALHTVSEHTVFACICLTRRTMSLPGVLVSAMQTGKVIRFDCVCDADDCRH